MDRETGTLLVAILLLSFCSGHLFAADALLVDEGRPRAEIVIAEQPRRTTRLAAHELQTYLAKISGATLPIVHEPSGAVPLRILVGHSRHTDKLGITPAGLHGGAYRIATGDDWLVLIGDDTEFTPIEPWARNNGDIVSGKLQREWNAITGAEWGAPNRGMYKERLRLPGDWGLPLGEGRGAGEEPLTLWDFDERGSFNAVCGFLRRLGVRWYLPGELGEVIPRQNTIPLPAVDETVRPDFPLRRFNFRLSVVGQDTALWSMRLGLRDPYGIETAHGLAHMTGRPEIFAAHPDWFALYGGKRRYDPRSSKNQLCYSNQELFEATVDYVRALFDHYRLEAVSVMPPDGYTAICQCPRCQGKDTPERGERGRLSDYVWDFVNRVAREVRKTHPDRKVLNCAYGVYTLPPLKLDKLEPNVVVSIVGGRRPRANRPEQQRELQDLREAWAAKTDNPIIIFENYPLIARGWYLPAFTPHSLGQSVNATKGISQGEDIWVSAGADFDQAGIGLNHFLVYFTARMYWGGPRQDVDALFREYCRLFYGPAENEMHAFFEFCEANWQEMEQDKAKTDRALQLFDAARQRTEPDSLYGRRLALIDQFLEGLRIKSRQLGQQRGPVPRLRLVGLARDPIVIDGRLDDEPWVNCPVAATGRLSELQTGRVPVFGTSFKAAWRGNDLYFAIRCDEHPGERPNVATTTKEDQAIWYGDAIEILLETESHSYYQIAVNPAGAVVDLDRGAERTAWFDWDSQAEVATHVAEDHWKVEIRIPVTQDENDPLHQVVGRKPTQSLPWHINICRQRIRENGSEYSAFSPTGTKTFHERMKFAHFYDGRSHEFRADPSATDYILASRAAERLQREGRHEEARGAFLALAGGEQVTDLQKSVAMARAAAIAQARGEEDRAAEIAGRIPIEAVADTVVMQNLLSARKPGELIERFGEEDIRRWPFWQAGEGYFARGRAYALTGAGEKADADLVRALEWTSDRRLRQQILLTLGDTRERLLGDDGGALTAYRRIVELDRKVGGADEFRALQGIARILARREKFDEALAAVRRADLPQLRGYWRGALLLDAADIEQAAGRGAEARKRYQAILDDQAIEPTHRKLARERLEAMEKK